MEAEVTESRAQSALSGLQWTLGAVIFIESVLFLMPAGRHDFVQSHMPNVVRYVLGWGEIAGSVLLLVPRTAVRGAWLLAVIFGFAIAIHLLHGMYNVGSLAIYTAAAFAVAMGKNA